MDINSTIINNSDHYLIKLDNFKLSNKNIATFKFFLKYQFTNFADTMINDGFILNSEDLDKIYYKMVYTNNIVSLTWLIEKFRDKINFFSIFNSNENICNVMDNMFTTILKYLDKDSIFNFFVKIPRIDLLKYICDNDIFKKSEIFNCFNRYYNNYVIIKYLTCKYSEYDFVENLSKTITRLEDCYQYCTIINNSDIMIKNKLELFINISKLYTTTGYIDGYGDILRQRKYECLYKLLMNNLEYFSIKYENINFRKIFYDFINDIINYVMKKQDTEKLIFYEKIIQYFPIMDNIDLLHKLSNDKVFFEFYTNLLRTRNIKNFLNFKQIY